MQVVDPHLLQRISRWYPHSDYSRVGAGLNKLLQHNFAEIKFLRIWGSVAKWVFLMRM
jgi:hypothetical protein